MTPDGEGGLGTEEFVGEAYVGSVESWGHVYPYSKKGTLAIHLQDEKLWKYRRHNVKFKVVILEDLGFVEQAKKEKKRKV